MTSDSAEDAAIDLRDEKSGARVNLKLPAQRAAMALIDLKTKSVIAKYGF
jgi:hypothetical protein